MQSVINPVATMWRASVDSPQRESLVGPLGRFSVAQSWQQIARLTSVLEEWNVRRSDRFVLVGPNSEYHFWSWLACEWTGAIFVPLSNRLSVAELSRIFADCTPKIILVGDDAEQLVLAAAQDAAEEAARQAAAEPCALGEAEFAPRIVTFSELHEKVGNTQPKLWQGQCGGIGSSLLASKPPISASAGYPRSSQATREQGETSVIVYTSGTSGRARGACHSRETMWWAWQNYRDCFDYSNLDTVVALAPLSHIGGFNGTTNDIFCRGGKVVVIDKFSPLQTAQLIRDERVNIGFAVPTMFVAMLNALREAGQLKAGEVAFPAWHRPLIGGAPLPSSLVEPLKQAGIFPIHVWGMTETGGAGCCLGVTDSLVFPGSAGRPFSYSDVVIVDDEGREICSPGVEGIVTIGGPHVVKCYWPNVPTEQVAGRLHTGDVAAWGEEGLIWFKGRASDTIITGGEKVQPVEIEQLLAQLPDIGDVAVVGLLDDYWGQRVCVVATGQVAIEQVKSYLNGKVSGYKVPKEVRRLETLPLNPSGKIDRARIRELLQSNAV